MSNNTKLASLPQQRQEAITELVALLQAIDLGRYAISLGGSYSKGGWDEVSDLDPHLFCERALPPASPDSEVWKPYFEALECWQQQGIIIDGIGVFDLASVNEDVAKWLSGTAVPPPAIWTVWGFQLPTNLLQHIALDDPYGIIEGWKQQLKTYPQALKDAVLQENLESLRYWRVDYHYRNKVAREDVVFLAGLSSKLVHQVNQILFALNETYYAGDGNNLRLIEQFEIRPDNFTERVTAILYPSPTLTLFRTQREALITLITDIEALVARHVPGLIQLEETS